MDFLDINTAPYIPSGSPFETLDFPYANKNVESIDMFSVLMHMYEDYIRRNLEWIERLLRQVKHDPVPQAGSEFVNGRLLAAAEQDIACDDAQMQAKFGARLFTVLTPPWNRISPAPTQRLQALGIRRFSQYFGLTQVAVLGLRQIDTHIHRQLEVCC